MSSVTKIILPKALLFDMDGTLTRPMLDFPRIKAEMGIGSKPILEALAEMRGAERGRAAQAAPRPAAPGVRSAARGGPGRLDDRRRRVRCRGRPRRRVAHSMGQPRRAQVVRGRALAERPRPAGANGAAAGVSLTQSI